MKQSESNERDGSNKITLKVIIRSTKPTVGKDSEHPEM